MNKFFLALVAPLILSACSTTSGLDATTKVGGFDGVKQVSIAPHGAACKSMGCPAIGALWLEDKPNLVGFRFQSVGDLSSIRSAHLNIDGQIYDFQNTGITNFDREAGTAKSWMMSVTDLNMVDRILNSKKTWLRITTSKGNVEAAIVDGGVDSKAFNALKRFKTQVDAAANQNK